jgi:hypothetical protein
MAALAQDLMGIKTEVEKRVMDTPKPWDDGYWSDFIKEMVEYLLARRS